MLDMRMGMCAGLGGLMVVYVCSSTGFAQKNFRAGDTFVHGEVLVKFKPGAAAADVGALNVRPGSSMQQLSPHLMIYHLKTTSPVQEAIAQCYSNPQVEYAEPNYIVYPGAAPRLAPNDPRFRALWGLHNTGQRQGTPDADIDAPEAWGMQTGSSDVVVAVIDTGSDINHIDKIRNRWRNTAETPRDGIDNDRNGFIDDVFGWDFFNDDATVFDPEDGDVHGTLTSGIIGARGNNGVGIAGVNWQVRIMTLKMLGPAGGTIADAIRAINYAADMGAHLVNASWGGANFSRALKESIEAAGMLFIASAGNAGTDTGRTPHYPASYASPNIIAVAATDRRDQKALFSNFGARTVDLGAPGVDILSTLPFNTYGLVSGTSFAAPHVTGVAALVLAHFPQATPLGVKARLLAGVDPVSGLAGKTVTGGRLNALKALTVALGSLSGTVSDASGTLIPHARVRLKKNGTNDVAVRMQANRHGTFRFSELPAGTYALSAEQEGVGEARVHVVFAQGENRRVALVLRVPPAAISQYTNAQ
jgi:subtilisin family serine protease